MQRFLHCGFRCHGLPIAAGHLAGASHVNRANRGCLACNSGGIGDGKHLTFEYAPLAYLRLDLSLEEEFYKLRPANKTDHLCQSWQ